MRKSSLKYVLVAGLTLATSFAFAASGQASGNLQPAAATGAPIGALDGKGVPLKIRIGGTNGIPVDAPAVALNVTVANGTAPASGGYVTVYPCGDRPDASNINFVTGQTIPNSVITPMSEFGDVCFYVYGIANLIVDVSGYFPSTSGFQSLSAPARIFNTRDGNRFGTTSTGGISVKRVKIAGAPTFTGVATGIPTSGIGAVALNLTAVGGFDKDGFGFITAYPCATTSISELPDASNVNFSGGEITANSALVPVSSDGYVCFYVYGNTDLLVDVSGYFPTGSAYTALSSPKRVVDTRGGDRFGTTSKEAVSVKRVKFAGAPTFTGEATGIPTTGIGAVSLNVTAAEGFDKDTYGFVTAYPCSSTTSAIPDVSNLNFAGGETIPNSVIIPLTNDGYACFYVYGNTDLLVDVGGTTTSNGFTALAGGPLRLRDTRKDPTPGPNALTYDFSDAVAVGVAQNSVARASLQVAEGRRGIQEVDESNLVVINEDGTTETAAVNGSAKIANTLTSPDGSVYVLYDRAANLDDSGTDTCLLARIDTDTGLPTCVDPNIQQFFWDANFRPSYNDPIQFDEAGNVYYSAIIAPAGSMEFRKWDRATGAITSLVQVDDFDLTTHADGRANSGVTIYNFLTRANGQTFITGWADVCDYGRDSNGDLSTTSPPLNAATPVVGQARTPVTDCYAEGYFIYMINPAGLITKLDAGNPSQFFKVFPDGDVYSTQDGVNNGIFRWNDAQDTFATPAYSSANFTGGVSVQAALAYHIISSKVLAIYSQMGDQTSWRISYVFPKTLIGTEIISAIKTQPLSQTISDYVVMTGKDAQGKNLTTLISASGNTPVETVLIGLTAPRASARVDLQISSYDVLAGGKVALSGTRVSDSAQVSGIFDFLTGELTLNATGAAGAIEDISPIVNEEAPG